MQAHVFYRLMHNQCHCLQFCLMAASSRFPQTHTQFSDECPVQYSSTNQEQESDKEDQLMESIFFIHTD